MSESSASCTFLRRAAALAALAAGLLAAAPAPAQVVIPVTTQFDLTGFLQSATLDPACASNPHCGGSLRVNGHVVTVPQETIVILPANALTWQELFAQAPAPYGLGTAPPSTGLALVDLPTPLTTYEVHVIGNRVTTAAGGDQYIAGLVNVTQQGLNTGAGYINFMDYSTGEMRVGGLLIDPTTGARVRLNDPTGRFGRATTPDQRFTVDPENPTIIAATGYPMCIPRVAPSGVPGQETDPLCPQGNRPPGLTSIITNSPLTLPGIPPDAFKQAPFEIGDYVTFAGTLVSDNVAAPTAGPLPATGIAGTYVSAHTIRNNTAINTWPGTNPVYVTVDVSLIGTGGLNVLGAGEATSRTRFEGMSTDSTRTIHLYGVDLDPLSGATADRDFGTIGVDPGPPTGAVQGRWRFRPPCKGASPTVKDCVSPPAGTFLPPPREVRAVVQGAWTPPAAPGTSPTAANGIVYGQYHAPIADYLFPENFPGTPIVANNFESIPFLAQGGYVSSAGTLVGQLKPWPGAVAPAAACQHPVASAGNPVSVASGAFVTLVGSATGTGPFTFAWAAPAGVTLSNPTVAAPTFTAPMVTTPTPLSFTLTVTGCGTTATASVVITVNAVAAPTVAAIAPRAVVSGAPVSLAATATDPAGLPVTFTWTQTSGPVTVLTPNPSSGAAISFTRVLPVGQATPDVFGFSVVATNSVGVSSAPQATTVTVSPLIDLVAVTLAQYRSTRLRLLVAATSSLASPNVVLTLQPYLTATGASFDPGPAAVFTNLGGGSYTLTLVGPPQPALDPARPIQVRSNLGGLSAPVAVSVRP